MKSGHLTLRKKMLLALLASFLPMLLAITLLFARSIRVQHRAHVQAISYTAQDISKTLDRFTEGVYSVSDAFSTDERLLEILDRSYSDNPNAKKYAITYTNGALFESYSRLVSRKRSMPSMWSTATMFWTFWTRTRPQHCSSKTLKHWE